MHSEISLPEHAPKEFADRSILWNSVEQVEKNKNAQLARMIKLNMPNAWSYDLAVATVRECVRNGQSMTAITSRPDSVISMHTSC